MATETCGVCKGTCDVPLILGDAFICASCLPDAPPNLIGAYVVMNCDPPATMASLLKKAHGFLTSGYVYWMVCPKVGCGWQSRSSEETSIEVIEREAGQHFISHVFARTDIRPQWMRAVGVFLVEDEGPPPSIDWPALLGNL